MRECACACAWGQGGGVCRNAMWVAREVNAPARVVLTHVELTQIDLVPALPEFEIRGGDKHPLVTPRGHCSAILKSVLPSC